MPTAPIVVLHIGPLDAGRNAYPLRYFAQDDHDHPAAEEWIAATSFTDETQPWSAAKILQFLGRENAESPKFREIGAFLAGLLEIGTVGPLWKAERDAARRENRVVRTALDVEPKDLRALPWELMFSDNTWLFRDVATPVYRAIRTKNPPPKEALPLRVAVVVGARDDEDQTIHWKAELEELRRRLRASGAAVELEEWIRPDADEVIELVHRVEPHIFHFIGHGEMTGNPKEPALIFSGVNKRYWTAANMRQDFGTARWRPPVVFFNACRSGAAAENAAELARILIEDGTCCVIGMQGDIDGQASAVFAARVYDAILKRRSIDVAIAEARIAVTQKLRETRDWALPAVYVSCAPDEALPNDFATDDAQTVMSQFTRRFKQLDDFVDRRDERRKVCAMFLQQDEQMLQENVVIVYGSDAIGKSDLALWCTRHLSLRGRRVRYVDLRAGGNSGETRTILATIRRGVKGAIGPVLGPLPPDHFKVFDRKLDAIEKGKPEDGSEPIQQLCDTFMDGLRELTKNEELLIILDHFQLKVRDVAGTIDRQDFDNYLKPSFFEPVASGQLPNLKLLLVMREADMVSDEGGVVGQTKIPVPTWDGDQFEWLARQFAIVEFGKEPDMVAVLMENYRKKKVAGPWGPSLLRDFGTFISHLVEKGPG